MLTSTVLLLVIVAQTPPSNPATPKTATVSPPARFYEPKFGDIASLAVQPGVPGAPRSFFLLTAPDKTAWNQFLMLNRTRAPRSQYEEMAGAGRLFSESADTRVRVIIPRPDVAVRVGDSAFYPVEVEILKGPGKGQRGFVSHRYLTPLPARPVAARAHNSSEHASPYRSATPNPGLQAATPPRDFLQERQQQYEAETLQRQRNNQDFQNTINMINQNMPIQQFPTNGVHYDQNNVIISP